MLAGTKPAPALASFSSTGPATYDVNVIKPDITGPGMNILAAWPFAVGSSSGGGASVYFNVVSGTSMATPHLSGIAALLKSAHPSRAPAAIKSAMMTATDIVANDGNQITDETLGPADFFGIGAGHINPVKASNPGLIYDIRPDLYLACLCGLHYTDRRVSIVARRAVSCSDIGILSPVDLNYPSFMVFLNAGNKYMVEAKRTVTNVGPANSTYTVKVEPLVNVTVDVTPK